MDANLFLLVFIILLSLSVESNCTIAPKEKQSRKSRSASTNKAQPGNSPNPSNRQTNNLSTDPTEVDNIRAEELTLQAILTQNLAGVTNSERTFRPTVLGYVTPWNNKGYDHAKNMGQKFDIIVPVWFQLVRKNGKVEFGGLHDIDEGWLQAVRESNPSVKIVPRLLFDGWSKPDINAFFQSELPQAAIVDKIVNQLVMKYKFDGIVCEILLQFGPEYKKQVLHFLSFLGENLLNKNLLLIVPLPPPIRNDGQPIGFFTVQDFNSIKKHISYFNIMTYDFNNAGTPGPVSPASWVAHCMLYHTQGQAPEDAEKFLLGLNFYGYDYTASSSGQLRNQQPIVGKDFIQLISSPSISSLATLAWDEKSSEHLLRVRGPTASSDSRFIFYPTLHSLMLRMQLAEKLGCGVAIWDIGQGIDSFFNLF